VNLLLGVDVGVADSWKKTRERAEELEAAQMEVVPAVLTALAVVASVVDAVEDYQTVASEEGVLEELKWALTS
jgi:hypothetical protein